MIRVEIGNNGFRGVSPNPMSSHLHVRYMALALLFSFCQVIGTMCVLPDLSEAQDMAVLMEDHTVCSMDGIVTCPPSLISSPERQLKHSPDTDHSAALYCVAGAIRTARSSPTPCARSSPLSIVPISIESSSVLRI